MAGEIGQEMFILERGFVRVVAEGFEDEVENDLLDEEDDELGQSLEGLLTPGAYFGEVALVEKTLRTATIIAATAGVVLVLDRDQYEERYAYARLRVVAGEGVESRGRDREVCWGWAGSCGTSRTLRGRWSGRRAR